MNKDNLRKVILDTDIGDDIDDSFALLLMLESHKFDVLGVTTVFRNAQKRGMMAKQLIDELGYDVKVYPGIDMPLKVKVEDLIQPEIKVKEKVDEFGKYLIPQWDESMRNHPVEATSAVDFIIEQIHKYPHEVTLIPIGPMTNIASAIIKDPSIVPLIKEVRFMGAGLDLNFVEWNIFCDPDAAKIVINSPIEKISAVTFNVTIQTGLSKERVEILKNSKSRPLQMVYKAMMKWFEHYNFDAPVMHDPLTVASLLDDTIVGFEKLPLDIDLSLRGMPFVNKESTNKVNVSRTVDKDKFFNIFSDVLKLK